MTRHIQTIEAAIAPHPVLRILASFPIACFCGVLATDVAYAMTTDMMWADFSAWLLAVGTILGVVAAFVGVAALVGRRRAVVPRRPAWPMALGSLVVLALAALNNLVHSRDAWTSVVPLGLALSALTMTMVLVTVWLGAAGSARQISTVSQGVRP